MSHNYKLLSHSAEETLEIGKLLGQACKGGELIALCGDLGAGKTLMTRGIGMGLEVKATIHSPTFALVNEYQGRLWLYHSDFYRLNQTEELDELGIEEYLSPKGILVVEWADKFETVLLQPYLKITIIPLKDDNREIILEQVGTPQDSMNSVLDLLAEKYPAN
jgi:tRNA threonylcarbamoyladenosine biosynthesis protein TsaE